MPDVFTVSLNKDDDDDDDDDAYLTLVCLFHKWEPAGRKVSTGTTCSSSAILNQFPELLQRYCACVCLIFLSLFHMWERRRLRLSRCLKSMPFEIIQSARSKQQTVTLFESNAL